MTDDQIRSELRARLGESAQKGGQLKGQQTILVHALDTMARHVGAAAIAPLRMVLSEVEDVIARPGAYELHSDIPQEQREMGQLALKAVADILTNALRLAGSDDACLAARDSGRA